LCQLSEGYYKATGLNESQRIVQLCMTIWLWAAGQQIQIFPFDLNSRIPTFLESTLSSDFLSVSLTSEVEQGSANTGPGVSL